MAKKTDKRERLITAANALYLEKSIDATTLADISHLAEVPLGNVYYYFKTKAELTSSVIKVRFKLLQEQLTKIEAENATAELQLKAFIQQFLNIKQAEPQNLGFIITVFWTELGKEGGELFKEFMSLPEYIIEWCSKRFAALNQEDKAREAAICLLTGLQGVCTMRHSPQAQDLLPLQTKFIEQAVGLA